jgi:hypothetical protein
MAGFSTVHVLVPDDSKSVKYQTKSKICSILSVYIVSVCMSGYIGFMEQLHYIPSQLADVQQILSDVPKRTVLFSHFRTPSVRLLKTVSKYESKY